MKFLSDYPGGSTEEVVRAFRDYSAYLRSVRERLPKSAYEFAAAPWHYDHNDHRCPHDSWVEALTISEAAAGKRREKRHIELAIRLLGAFHDGYLELSYSDVEAYSLVGASDKKRVIGHDDWLADEVRLSEKNLVDHEILFRGTSRWLIECGDINVVWTPA